MEAEPFAITATAAPLHRPALRRMLALARPYVGILCAASLLMLLSSAVSLTLPLVARAAVNRVMHTGQARVIDRFALELLLLILLMTASSLGEYLLAAYAGNRIVQNLRSRLFEHLQRLPAAFFDQARTGDLASCLANDIGLLQQTFTDDTVRILGSLITIVGGVILASVIDLPLTVVVIAVLGGTFGVFTLLGLRVRRIARETQGALAEAMGAGTEVLNNIRIVKAFVREPYEACRFNAGMARIFRLSMRSSASEAGLSTLGKITFIAILVGVFWIGGRSVLSGSMSPGSLLAFLMIVAIIGGPIANVAGVYGRLQRAVGAAERVFQFLDLQPEPPEAPGARRFPAGEGHVSFERVRFGYDPNVPVLQDFSLELPAGRVTALVGESGSGKSTVALLLFRLYEPQSGCIRIEGVPLMEIDRSELREAIGLVPQDPVLFKGTIRENIRYGRLTATDAEVEAAARLANVDEFVAHLPGGYDAMVGERGVTLSGGQRQRVAIARAVLKDPRILVLDEATSALDPHSEYLVRQAMEQLMRGRTTLVIAHRMSSVETADQVAVLKAGRIVERGTHAELLRRKGYYAALQQLAGVASAEEPERELAAARVLTAYPREC